MVHMVFSYDAYESELQYVLSFFYLNELKLCWMKTDISYKAYWQSMDILNGSSVGPSDFSSGHAPVHLLPRPGWVKWGR